MSRLGRALDKAGEFLGGITGDEGYGVVKQSAAGNWMEEAAKAQRAVGRREGSSRREGERALRSMALQDPLRQQQARYQSGPRSSGDGRRRDSSEAAEAAPTPVPAAAEHVEAPAEAVHSPGYIGSHIDEFGK